jgi:4'-phosphopantetheinyl transferase
MLTRLGLFDGKPASRRAALLEFCAETLGVACARLALARDPLGAPLLLVDGARGEWRVSSSSRENVFLFGLARGERIGVDVEIVRPIEPPDVALHPGERRRLAALPTAAAIDAFYELWTLKEAYAKALGVGLRREFGDILVGAGAVVAIEDGRQQVALASARRWRETFSEKPVIAAALTLAAPAL